MTNTTLPKPQSSDEKAEMFRRLEDLYWLCKRDGLNKQDQAIVLIRACIEEGITTGPSIVGTAAHVGLNPKHVGAVLTKSIGNLWHRDDNRVYSLLPPLS